MIIMNSCAIVLQAKSTNFAVFKIIGYFLAKVAIPIKYKINVRGK